MPVPEPISNRLIGALFVGRGLVSESQLHVALELQQETGQQLGQILVERFGVQRGDLAKVVAEHWARMGEAEEDARSRASESWRQLGEILVSRGFVTHEQLEQALARQRETGERLGEALVEQGILSKFELAGSLAEQASTAEGEKPVEMVEADVVHLAPRRESPVAPKPDPVVMPEPASEPILLVEPEGEPEPEASAEAERAAPAWVAFASTPRGYHLVALDHGPVPDVGDRVELAELGELVVLRVGVSPLPLDERVCAFLEPAGTHA
jgi:hypothetical protein